MLLSAACFSPAKQFIAQETALQLITGELEFILQYLFSRLFNYIHFHNACKLHLDLPVIFGYKTVFFYAMACLSSGVDIHSLSEIDVFTGLQVENCNQSLGPCRDWLFCVHPCCDFYAVWNLEWLFFFFFFLCVLTEQQRLLNHYCRRHDIQNQ